MSSQFPEARPRRLRRNASLRSLFQETEFTLNDLVLPIFVEEEIDDFVPIKSMPGVMRIPESKLAGEIERYARAGIKSVMTFGVSHHLDSSGSDTWNDNGLVSRMSRIAKDAVPDMIVMSGSAALRSFQSLPVFWPVIEPMYTHVAPEALIFSARAA